MSKNSDKQLNFNEKKMISLYSIGINLLLSVIKILFPHGLYKVENDA